MILIYEVFMLIQHVNSINTEEFSSSNQCGIGLLFSKILVNISSCQIILYVRQLVIQEMRFKSA